MGLGRSLDLRWMEKIAGGGVETDDQVVNQFCKETPDQGGKQEMKARCVTRRFTQHNPTPTAAVADPSQGNQKRTNYKDKQSICTAGTFRLTCTHAMANQALLCQPYPFRNQIKSLRPHHDINPKGHRSGTTRAHKYLNV